MNWGTTVSTDSDEEELAPPVGPAGSDKESQPDDALRQYMKNIGDAALLTRDGEVVLGKQLAEGRKRVLAVILSCPSAVAELLSLRTKILRREIPLRDVISVVEPEDGAANQEQSEDAERVLRVLKVARRYHLKLNRAQRQLDSKLGVAVAHRYLLQEQVAALQAALLQIVSSLELSPKLITWLAEHVKALAPALVPELAAAEHLRDSASHALVRANLRLVVSVARRYTPNHMQLLDLVQDGNIGLMRAAEKFDYQRGYRFSTYAVYWIRQAVVRGIFDQSRTIRLPVYVWEQARKLNQLTANLWRQSGREPTAEELAQQTGLKLAQVQIVLSASEKVPISIDYPAAPGYSANLGDLLPDTSAVSPAEALDREAMSHCVRYLLKELSPRERKVLRLRLGLGRNDQKTLEEVGKSCGVSRERARRLEVRALLKLRSSPNIAQLKVLLEA